MYTRVASAIALVACLVLSPMALAGAKDKETAKPAVKKDVSTKSKGGTTWQGKGSKTSPAPTVRAIPYQGATSRPSAANRTATTRPAGEYKFVTPAKYDYFSDRYGFSTGSPKSDVVGYVPPEKSSSNAGNPFIYRRTQ